MFVFLLVGLLYINYYFTGVYVSETFTTSIDRKKTIVFKGTGVLTDVQVKRGYL